MQAVPKSKNLAQFVGICHTRDRTCQDLVYSCTYFDVYIFTHSRFTEGGLKFKKMAH